MTKTPAWVEAKLIADHDMTPQRVTGKPRQRTCPTCTQHVVVALIAHTGTVAAVDLAPTTTVGELVAIAAGRRTFLVTSFYGIERRFDFDIAYLTADKARDVHVEHSCHSPPLPIHPEYRTPIRSLNKTNTPPF